MTPLEKVKSLSCWRGPISAAPLGGGITNHNFLVQDGAKRAVVRIGDDIAVHHILRFNELAASQAAFAAGISPAVLHHEAGALVIDYIDGRTMAAGDLRQDDLLDQALDLVARVHRDMPRYLQGPSHRARLCCRLFSAPLLGGGRDFVTPPSGANHRWYFDQSHRAGR